MMPNRSVLAVDLKDDPAGIATYVEYHQRVFPEVLASLRQAGIRELDIYLLGRRLVMIVETDGSDVGECFARHRGSAAPRVIEWEALMKSLQEPPPGSAPDEWWAEMRPVFRLADADDGSGWPARR
jgi:L-rhamnose mutarotase